MMVNVRLLRASALTAVVCGFVVGCSGTSEPEAPSAVVIVDAPDMAVGADASVDMAPQFELPVVADWPVLEDKNPAPDVVEVELEAAEVELDIGAGSPIKMMAYNGVVPGPLLQAKRGDKVIVHFKNSLKSATTIHWHGLRISDQMDGSPRIQRPVGAGERFDYEFTVPDAGTFWYHPHVRANEQVELGLYGPLIVHDPKDPVVELERVIMVDDILLSEAAVAPFMQGHMEAMHGRTGNNLLINGQTKTPALSAQQGVGVERWRIINPANARTFEVSFDGAPMRVVATDGGVLPQPYEATRLSLAVGQRYDVEVLVRPEQPQQLWAHIPVLNDQNEVVEAPFELYRVTPSAAVSEQAAPLHWDGEPSPTPLPTRYEEYVFEGKENVFGSLEWTINGQAHRTEPLSTFGFGEVVAMTLVNTQGQEHPFHLHGQFFRIIDDGAGRLVPGLKDTVLVPGNAKVRIVAYMNNPGRWMAHCHILEHAELGMMSEIVVEPPTSP